jgi:hypothetical protein
MQMNKIMRPLHYHPEPIRSAQGQLREGSGVLGREMLRCAQHDRAGTSAASAECHPEPIRSAQCKLREGSGALGTEMLRFAQHDRAGTHTDAWINLFMCIIGPYDMAGVFRYSSLSRPHW